MIAVFIALTPAFVTHLRTDAVLKDLPGVLNVIFENGISNQVTSVALIILAIIQAKRSYLSMYHVIIVLNLSWILTLPMICSLLRLELYQGGAHKHHLKKKALAISFISIFGGIFKGAFGFWVTLSPRSFHSTNSAGDLQNGVKFFMFGKNFNTSSHFFHYFWMATYVSALLVYSPPFLAGCYAILND